MHIFKLNFWSKFQRKKKLVKSCEPFSRNVSYLFCTVLIHRDLGVSADPLDVRNEPQQCTYPQPSCSSKDSIV